MDLIRKATTKTVTETPKEYKLSYFYASLAALFFGLANFCMAEIAKLGNNSLWA